MATDAEAQAALYDAVVKLSEKATQVVPVAGAKMLLAAAVAYRAAEGGPQVGAVDLGE